MKNLKIFAVAIAICGASLVGYNAYSNATMTEQERLFQQNLEALTNDENNPEWWDFFNNYIVEERIPVTTSASGYSSITVNGVVISLGYSVNYTYAVYHHCYDGGVRDECISSGVYTYV